MRGDTRAAIGVYRRLLRQLAEELKEAGLTRIHITLYGNQGDRKAMHEWVRREIMPLFPEESNVLTWELDDRLSIYDQEHQTDRGNCYAPLSTIVVTRDAEWALCCRDWKRTVTFGSLKENTFEELLRSEEPHRVYEALRVGDRTVLDICRRCKSAITPG